MWAGGNDGKGNEHERRKNRTSSYRNCSNGSWIRSSGSSGADGLAGNVLKRTGGRKALSYGELGKWYRRYVVATMQSWKFDSFTPH